MDYQTVANIDESYFEDKHFNKEMVKRFFELRDEIGILEEGAYCYIPVGSVLSYANETIDSLTNIIEEIKEECGVAHKSTLEENGVLTGVSLWAVLYFLSGYHPELNRDNNILVEFSEIASIGERFLATYTPPLFSSHKTYVKAMADSWVAMGVEGSWQDYVDAIDAFVLIQVRNSGFCIKPLELWSESDRHKYLATSLDLLCASNFLSMKFKVPVNGGLL